MLTKSKDLLCYAKREQQKWGLFVSNAVKKLIIMSFSFHNTDACPGLPQTARFHLSLKLEHNVPGWYKSVGCIKTSCSLTVLAATMLTGYLWTSIFSLLNHFLTCPSGKPNYRKEGKKGKKKRQNWRNHHVHWYGMCIFKIQVLIPHSLRME